MPTFVPSKSGKGGSWRAQYRDASGRRCSVTWDDLDKPTKKHEHEAQGRLGVIREHVKRQRLGLDPMTLNARGLTVVEAVAEWDRRYGRTLSPKWRDTVLGYMRKHVEGEPWAQRRLEHVDLATATDFLAGLPVGPATKRKIRTILQGVYTVMTDAGLYTGENPWAKAKDAKVPKPSRKPLPPDLVWPLVDGCVRKKTRQIFLVAAFQGMRLGEIVKMRGEHWDDRLRALHIPDTKTGVPRLVPLHPEVESWLVPMLERQPGLIWPANRGAIAGAVKVPDGGKLMREGLRRIGLKLPGVVFHSLRHTWATQFIECGGNWNARQTLGWGGKTGRTSDDTYTSHRVEFLRTELGRLHYPRPKAQEEEGK